MRRAVRAWPAAVIGAALTAIAALGFGVQLPWWYLMLWPAMTAGLALLLIFMRRVRAADYDRLCYQAQTIEMQIAHIQELVQLLGELNRERP